MTDSDIRAPFLNRAGEFKPDEWFQLVPKGTFPISRKEKDGQTRDYVQVIDDAAVQKMDAAFKNRRAANPEFRMLVDFEHFSHDPSKSSAAACWVTDTEARADGLWAKGEWSDEGEAAIKNRRYRYLSPVWFPNQTEKLGGNRFRPIQVNDAGLTNKPNLGDALQPFWNRADEFHGREAKTETEPSHMKERLIVICGLAAAATDEQIVAAVEGFKNRAVQLDATKASLDTLTTDNTALKNRYQTLLTQSVDRTLDEYKGVITEESKTAWKNRLTEDLDGTVALLKGIKAPAKASPVHNAGKGAAAAAKKDAAAETEDGTVPFMNRVTAVMSERKLDRAEAIGVVAAEEPALYDGYRSAMTGRESEE